MLGLLSRQLRTVTGNRRVPYFFRSLSSFHERKVTQEFDNVLDRNKDGYVDKKDILALKTKMRQYSADMRPDLSKALNPYTAGYDDYWTLLYQFADTSPTDGKISRDEWIALWDNIVKSSKDATFNSLPQWVKLMPTGVFPVMDYNADDVIDELEYRRFWHFVCGYPFLSDPEVKSYFDVMTENGKHPLDLKRFQELYADFYLNEDENSPGRFVGGPIQY